MRTGAAERCGREGRLFLLQQGASSVSRILITGGFGMAGSHLIQSSVRRCEVASRRRGSAHSMGSSVRRPAPHLSKPMTPWPDRSARGMPYERFPPSFDSAFIAVQRSALWTTKVTGLGRCARRFGGVGFRIALPLAKVDPLVVHDCESQVDTVAHPESKVSALRQTVNIVFCSSSSAVQS